MVEETINSALKQTDELGWAVVSMGEHASAKDMEIVGKTLLRIEDGDGGTYNGSGGVTRASLHNSSWLNAAEGAPAMLRIQFHNEMAYARRFPRYVAFAMFRPADVDGTTLVVDNVEVTQRLSEPLKKKMYEMGVRYIRLLHDETESGLPDYYNSWQAAFCTTDPDEAMGKATAADMFAKWYEGPGGTRRMKHTAWSPLFVTHPVQGELYFTSVLNRHGSWLDGHDVWGALPLEKRPYQCVWGDGTPFSDEELDELRKVQDGAMERVQLKQGDVIVVDNLRVQHGRTPFQGKRLLGLMLSHMVNREAKHQPPACFNEGTEMPTKKPRPI